MLRARITRRLSDAGADHVGRRWQRLWVTALVAALICLVPLGHASPSDPVWIAGTYDAADSDDVLVKATSLETSVDDALLTISPVSNFGAVPLGMTSVVPASTLRGVQARAPPRVETH